MQGNGNFGRGEEEAGKERVRRVGGGRGEVGRVREGWDAA